MQLSYLLLGKADKYKDSERNGTDSPSSKKRRIEESSSTKHDSKRDKHKSSSSSSHSSGSKHSSRRPVASWVQPLLKVKVIDRKYKDGRYYSSKVVVYDVLPDSIVCKTESGKLLEGELFTLDSTDLY